LHPRAGESRPDNQKSKIKNQKFICLILAIGCLVLYGRVIRYDFARYDDETYVTANRHVQQGPFLSQMVWAFTTDEGGNWHPLTWLSHILDWRLYHSWAGGHHLTNVVFHVANTLLLFWLLTMITCVVWRSAIVAGLFAWHPLHVESVAWIAERKDLLSTFFGLLALAAYVRYVGGSKVQSPTPLYREREPKVEDNISQEPKVFYVLSLLCFALALLSKPMLVTLPFVLLLLDYWPLRRSSSFVERRFLVEKAPFLALAAVSCVITMVVQSRGGVVTLATVTPAQRMANVLVSYVRYLQKMIWPVDLCVFYPFHFDWPVWLVIGCGLFLLVVTGAVLARGRRRPWLAVGWLWYLGTLVPVIGFVQVGMQSMADRYTYLPLVGIAIALVWEISDRMENSQAEWRHAAKAGSSSILLALCLALAWRQVSTWRNAITLFSHAVSVTTDNYVAEVNLGVALYYAAKTDDAISHFNAALRLRSDSPLPAFNLGRAFEQKGNVQNALNWFELAVRTRPDFAPARYDFARLLAKEGKLDEAVAQFSECLRYTREPGEVHFALANALAAEGKLDEAAAHYGQSIELDPNSADAHNNLGAVLVRLGNPTAAVDHFKAALALRHNFPEAEDQLGSALQKLGRLDEAREHFANSVRLKPDFSHAQLKLGLLLAQQGRFDEATNHFEKVLQLEPTNDAAWFDLAGAFAALGRPEDAAAAYARELQLKPQDVEAHVRLGAVLLRENKIDAAISEYERAAALTNHRDLMVLGLLEQAYAAAGRFQEAIKTAREVEELATSLNQPDLAEQAARRIALYRDGKRPPENSNVKP